MSDLVVYSVDAERSVLGAAILRPDIAGWLELATSDFHDPRHRAVWQAMLDLHDDGIPIDETTLTDRLAASARLAAVGGMAYLSDLVLSVVTADNVQHYAQIIRSHAVTRQVLTIASAARQRLERGEAAGDELLDRTMRDLASVETPDSEAGVDIAMEVTDEYARIAEHARRTASGETVYAGVPTGVTAVDCATGGLPVGLLSVLAARPGMYKSTLAGVFADGAAESGAGGVHVFSYEDPPATWAQRRLARISGVPVDRIASRGLKYGDLEKLGQARAQIAGSKGWHIERAGGVRVDRVIRRFRAQRKRLGTVLLIVDYLQRMPAPIGRYDKRHEELAANVLALAELAASDDVAVLLVSQLGREIDKREDKRPIYSDLKGTSELEQSGKLILSPFWPAKHHKVWPKGTPRAGECVDPRELIVEIMKHHQGEAGVQVTLTLDAPTGRIS